MCSDVKDHIERLYENFVNACDNVDLSNLIYEKFGSWEEQYNRFKRDIWTEEVIQKAFDSLYERDLGETLHYAKTPGDYIDLINRK